MILNEKGTGEFFLIDWFTTAPYEKLTKQIDKGIEDIKNRWNNTGSLFPSEAVFSYFWGYVDRIQSKEWGYSEATQFLTNMYYNSDFQANLGKVTFLNEKDQPISAYIVLTETMEKKQMSGIVEGVDEEVWVEATPETYQIPSPITVTPSITTTQQDLIKVSDTVTEVIKKTQTDFSSMWERIKVPLFIGVGLFVAYQIASPFIMESIRTNAKTKQVRKAETMEEK